MARLFSSGVRPALAVKLGAAALLVAVADVLIFQSRGVVWTLGGFALAFALSWAAVQPASTRDRRTLAFLGLALVMGLVLAVRPTFAGWFLFGCFIGLASLSPRAGPRDDAFTFLQRLANGVGADGLTGVSAVAVYEQNVYVVGQSVNASDNTLVTFSRDPGTGLLTFAVSAERRAYRTWKLRILERSSGRFFVSGLSGSSATCRIASARTAAYLCRPSGPQRSALVARMLARSICAGRASRNRAMRP